MGIEGRYCPPIPEGPGRRGVAPGALEGERFGHAELRLLHVRLLGEGRPAEPRRCAGQQAPRAGVPDIEQRRAVRPTRGRRVRLSHHGCAYPFRRAMSPTGSRNALPRWQRVLDIEVWTLGAAFVAATFAPYHFVTLVAPVADRRRGVRPLVRRVLRARVQGARRVVPRGSARGARRRERRGGRAGVRRVHARAEVGAGRGRHPRAPAGAVRSDSAGYTRLRNFFAPLPPSIPRIEACTIRAASSISVRARPSISLAPTTAGQSAPRSTTIRTVRSLRSAGQRSGRSHADIPPIPQ